MRIEKVKKRSWLFICNSSSDWDVNIHLIMGRRYNYIIDTGLGPQCATPVKEFIQHDEKPVIVVNTHYHWDHIWGNGLFKGCTIISHRLCREMIKSNWQDMLDRKGEYRQGEVEMCLPDLVFENELSFPEDNIKIIYTPGHTTDSISVLDKEDKVLNAADNIGDTEEELVPSISSGESIYTDTLLKYKGMDFDTCISGHNIVLGKEVFDRILGML